MGWRYKRLKSEMDLEITYMEIMRMSKLSFEWWDGQEDNILDHGSIYWRPDALDRMKDTEIYWAVLICRYCSKYFEYISLFNPHSRKGMWRTKRNQSAESWKMKKFFYFC